MSSIRLGSTGVGLLSASVFLLAPACGDTPPADSGAEDDAVLDATREAVDTSSIDTSGQEAGVQEELPLVVIMRQLSSDLTAFSNALWLEDYQEMTARAASIADHPGMTAEEVQRIQTELGPGMDDFLEADEAVHQASVRMQEAARDQQLDAILDNLAEVQRGCVACHSRFRERLRTVPR